MSESIGDGSRVLSSTDTTLLTFILKRVPVAYARISLEQQHCCSDSCTASPYLEGLLGNILFITYGSSMINTHILCNVNTYDVIIILLHTTLRPVIHKETCTLIY